MTNRKTQKIARSINLLAQLPDGDALVHVLGDGNESTNLEALRHWVEGTTSWMASIHFFTSNT